MSVPQSSRAPHACDVLLPCVDGSPPTILDFLCARFPHLGRDVWRGRLETGAITDEAGNEVTTETAYRPKARLQYYREVPAEPRIPFEETVVFQNADIVVACKPHFLPVTPGGGHVNECLLYRLWARTGNRDLVPVNRLDRETAGLVLFSARPQSREAYYRLFRRGQINKVYAAIAAAPRNADQREWLVEDRIRQGPEWFRSAVTTGAVNARTRIRLLEARERLARYEVEPLTGKRHQVRLHLCAIGAPIVNDWLYPELQPEPKTGFDRPLQLLAQRLMFEDPLTRQMFTFESPRRLAAWPA